MQRERWHGTLELLVGTPPHFALILLPITLAMVAGIGLRTLARVIHAHPTQAEAIREAANAYTRTRLTPTIRSLVRRWLAW